MSIGKVHTVPSLHEGHGTVSLSRDKGIVVIEVVKSGERLRMLDNLAAGGRIVRPATVVAYGRVAQTRAWRPVSDIAARTDSGIWRKFWEY